MRAHKPMGSESRSGQLFIGLATVALLSYTCTKYFENKYDPDIPVSSQMVYHTLSTKDQEIITKLIPVLNNGLVEEQGFWEKHANYVMNKTSQTQFEQAVKQAILVEKQCASNGTHVSHVEKPYFEWNPIDISCS